jgi:hypothetical protein
VSDYKFKSKVRAEGGASVPAEAANRALQTNGSSDIVASSVTSTELGHLSGVSGSLQVQLNTLTSSLSDANQDIADLVSLSGVAANSTDLGTFTGSTIQDNSTIKEALQDLETEVELKADDADVLKKDGSVSMTGDLNLGGNDINNVVSVNAQTGSNLTLKAAASQNAYLESQSSNAGIAVYSTGDNLDVYGVQIAVSAEDALSVYATNGNIDIYSTTLATGKVKIFADGASGEVRIGLDAGANPLVNLVKIGGAELEISSDIIDFTNTRLENVADPTDDQDAATKAYVDNAIAGLRWKQPVKAASTVDLTLSGEQTVDTVALVTGDRILVKNQTDEIENGIYVVASGAWSRAVDADNSPSEELLKAAVFVIAGSQATTGWVNSNLGPITIGVTEITFVQFSATVSAYVGGDGIDVIGPTISVDHDGQGLAFSTGELVLELDGSTLSKSASGLKVADSGITNTQVAANAAIELSKLEVLTASRAVQTDASGELSVSAITSVELGYLSGATSNIQDQLDALPIASTGDINQTSFSSANNQASPANVTGFAFANASVRSFKAQVSATIDATADLFEVFELLGVQRGADWALSVASTGDDSGIVFSITNAGQVQYTSTNVSGFSSGVIKFRAQVTNV